MKKIVLVALMALCSVSVGFGGDVAPDDKKLSHCNDVCYNHTYYNCPKFDAASCFKKQKQECVDECLKK